LPLLQFKVSNIQTCSCISVFILTVTLFCRDNQHKIEISTKTYLDVES